VRPSLPITPVYPTASKSLHFFSIFSFTTFHYLAKKTTSTSPQTEIFSINSKGVKVTTQRQTAYSLEVILAAVNPLKGEYYCNGRKL
jgi:hypothetical protein